MSPNRRIPAVVEHAPAVGREPLALFESGEILLRLAEKTGRLLTAGLRERQEALTWLFWQLGGPMLRRAHQFRRFAPLRLPYASRRHTQEAARRYGLLDRRLGSGIYDCVGKGFASDRERRGLRSASHLCLEAAN